VRLSQVCIDRPVLTAVLSLVILLVGGISLPRLANRELPDIDRPVVSITTVYPGASAEVVETSVTDVVEDAVNGIAGVRHVVSGSREQVSDISVEFELTRDIEAAANDIRDRVSRVRGQLPEEAEDPVIAKRDADAQAIVWVSFSGEGRTQIELTTILETRIQDRLAKLPGVASIMVSGEQRYSMRVWIDNRQLGAHNLTIAEVVAALRKENVDIPSGRVESADVEFTVRSLGELHTPEEYRNLVVAVVGGRPVQLGDIARVEVGPESTRKLVRFNGVPGIGVGVIKQSKANTLSVAQAVRAEVEAINQELEEGLALEVAYDSSVHIRESVDDVTRTIFEASLLVILVIYVFLRSFRATLVPALAIPVSIVGAFAFLYFFGYSVNTLTLMGVTLAIGLVVDDAIVVLENITRWVEQGTPPMEAARRGMAEISFAVVAATISAVAVFLPLAFLTDETGRLFREFAVTVAAAVAISGFVALTLAPALCARLVRPQQQESGPKYWMGRAVDGLSGGYRRALRPVATRPRLALAAVGLGVLWLGLGGWLYTVIDEELVAKSDRGALFIITIAPEGSTVDFMDRYQAQAEAVVLDEPEVHKTFSVVGLGIGAPAEVNRGIVISQLVHRDEREASQDEVIRRIQPELERIPGLRTFALSPNPLQGFTSDPVQVVVQGPDLRELARIADEIEAELQEDGRFLSVRHDLVLNKPQLDVRIDRQRASDLGISAQQIGQALQILLGGLDITSFKQGGETYDVIAQLEQHERSTPRNILELFVRGHSGLIPLAAAVDARETIAPQSIRHFDRFRAVTITAGVQEGFSVGEGLARIEEIARSHLPEEGGYAIRFSGEAEKFFESSNALVFAYLLSILVVYLVLCAQFESFLYPVIIMVAVLLSFTGALVSLALAGMTLNLFSKIGIVMLVGLVTKNSILIVEFANQLRDRGAGVGEAALEAAATRFRPILMTSLATIAGITPIALGFGAGGEARQPLGVAVVGGMALTTLLTFFVVPATYATVERLRGWRGRGPARSPAPAPVPVAGGR